MMNATVQKVAKHSLLYSYVLSQPFATYVDIYPALENKILMNVEEIKYGDQGESIRILQKKLTQLNYYTAEIDGDYGVRTEHAVKTLQRHYNIPSNGRTDKVSIEQLLELTKERYIKDITELNESISPGMKSEDVEIVQKALAYFDYYQGNIDGIYGPLTMQALQIAEDEHDLELVSEVTIQSLHAIYEKVEEEQIAEVQTENNAEQKTEQVEEITEPKQVESSPNNGNVVSQAQNYLGTPYVWGGDSPSGFDCSGFLNFVFEQENKTIPRTVSEIWNFSTPVDQPSVGDIVFFETYQAGASHAGIYIGDGKFIHAGVTNGVEISELDQEYWQERYIGANRIE